MLTLFLTLLAITTLTPELLVLVVITGTLDLRERTALDY